TYTSRSAAGCLLKISFCTQLAPRRHSGQVGEINNSRRGWPMSWAKRAWRSASLDRSCMPPAGRAAKPGTDVSRYTKSWIAASATASGNNQPRSSPLSSLRTWLRETCVAAVILMGLMVFSNSNSEPDATLHLCSSSVWRTELISWKHTAIWQAQLGRDDFVL